MKGQLLISSFHNVPRLCGYVDRVAVMTVGYQPGVFFFFRGRSVFNPCFTKFVLKSIGGIKSVILAERFNTGGPNSTTVRMEYLFALQF